MVAEEKAAAPAALSLPTPLPQEEAALALAEARAPTATGAQAAYAQAARDGDDAGGRASDTHAVKMHVDIDEGARETFDIGRGGGALPLPTPRTGLCGSVPPLLPLAPAKLATVAWGAATDKAALALAASVKAKTELTTASMAAEAAPAAPSDKTTLRPRQMLAAVPTADQNPRPPPTH